MAASGSFIPTPLAHADNLEGRPYHYFIVGTLNSQRYISEVLERVILPYIQRKPLVIFKQDNSQPHVTRNAQEFFFTHHIE
ncbi:hypothetical protein TNCV_903571 [Trichonephila clavipes]|nr:hypothetical protein TNCV_903571 [Trichonephila clavipes]